MTVPESLTLDKYIGKGRQPGEGELDTDAAPAVPEVNAAALSQLEAMGFPTNRCMKALLATGNSDPEAAMNWLFEHMDEDGLDDPIPTGAPSAASEPSPEQISMLADMGFTAAQARKALRETVSQVKDLADLRMEMQSTQSSGYSLTLTTMGRKARLSPHKEERSMSAARHLFLQTTDSRHSSRTRAHQSTLVTMSQPSANPRQAWPTRTRRSGYSSMMRR